MRTLSSLTAGIIFGLGLIVSGMADPAKVKNFLDVFGTWDPSLAFVMGGAVIVTAIGYRFVLARSSPLLDTSFRLPATNRVDAPLIAGSAVFGIGWGLSGFCPGPAIVALPLMSPGTLAFVPAMLAGLALTRAIAASPKSTIETQAPA